MALVLAPILGTIFTMIAAVALDAVIGKTVTGGVWALSIPNVIVILLTGFYTGFMAALFAGRRGLLVAGLANWLPLILLVVLSLMLNRDAIRTRAGASVADWVWIGFLPALAGGYIGAPRVRRKRAADKTAEVFD
jgi:hypothetical protein